MKQRIRVAGIIQKGDEILIMKRAQGRTDAPVMWELPTGKIKFGEQPEEAVDRMLEEYLGIELTEKTALRDVITFLAPSMSTGASQLNNLYIIYDVTLLEGTKIEPAERYTAYKYIKPGELGAYRLDETGIVALEILSREGGRSGHRELAHSATVYVDGCSRGNPGPSGIGYHIIGENGATLACGGEFIGFATSRVSEYYALKEGCEQAIELGLKTVRFVSDNLMLVNQMKGIYKIKNRDLLSIYDDIQELLKNFDAYSFMHVKREQNTKADAQANAAVDREFSAE